jgi:6-pyruvoyl-tetrahydropterin synthase
MGELDQIYETFTRRKKEYNKEEYIEFKKREKQDIYELIDKTAERIVQSNQEFKQYLNTKSRFEQYSVGNTLLVMAQMPSATMVRDYESWVNSGGFPKKSRKDIKILEPADSYMREDGSVGTNYNVKYVMDISQVSIKQKQRIANYDKKLLLKVFLNSNQGKLQIVDTIPNTEKTALYNMENDTLYIAKGSDAPYIFYDVTRELAKQEMGEETPLDTFKISCVSYMLCKKYGIDVSNYNIEVPFELKELSSKEIREELEPINNAMENICGRTNYYIEMFAKQNREQEQAR